MLAILLTLPLYDEATMLYVLETLEGERLHVVLLESYLHRSPACLPLHLLVQTCISLGKHILQIQVEVFHAIAATAEHGEDGTYNLAVLIANQSAAKS